MVGVKYILTCWGTNWEQGSQTGDLSKDVLPSRGCFTFLASDRSWCVDEEKA